MVARHFFDHVAPDGSTLSYRDIGIGVTSGTPCPRGGPGGTYTAACGARVQRR